MNWMKPNVAWAATARLVFSGLVVLTATLPALAGDRALLDYVGFSRDFRYFAFEEFGIQDGSGLAYSNIYVVDLDTDSWVIGTPVRIEAEAESASLSSIRDAAARRAEGHFDEFGIDVPVEIAAMIGDGVPDTDARELVFGAPGYLPGAVSGRYTLRLDTFETSATSPCAEWFSVAAKGYELAIADAGGARLIHRDQNLPRSRGCPLDYRIHSVVMPFEGATLSNAVAIISVYPGGFEGPDRRFLAVPLGL